MPDSHFALPPDGLGKKIATKIKTIGVDQTHVQYVEVDEERTFIVWSIGTAPAQNKSMLSLLNAHASEIMEVQEIFVVNSSGSGALTGVQHDFRLFRMTGHSVGTDLTIKPMDTADSLPAGITGKSGATITGEEATPLDRWLKWSDEMKLALDYATMENLLATLIPAWEMTQRKTKSIILRQNQGITIKSITNSTVGLFDVGVIFTLKNT